MPENKDRINHPFVYSMSASLIGLWSITHRFMEHHSSVYGVSLIGLWSITQRFMEDYSGPRLAIKYRGSF